MQAEEFVKRVRMRAGYKDNEQAQNGIDAVFGALRARISHEGGDNIAEQLPKELKDMWESGTVKHILREFTGFERMDLGGFLAKVAKDAGFDDVRQSEVLTCAVFKTMRDQLTPGAQGTISAELPPDIREFWESCTSVETETETGPLEVEAPVSGCMECVVSSETELLRPEEEAGARPWGPETDVPTGADVEMVIAQTEAQVRDMKKEERSKQVHEEKVQPPAAERVIEVPPPGKHGTGVTGPGDETFYRSDEQLTEEIEDLLEESGELDPMNIDVYVQAGNVTLRGTVKSEEEREAASRAVTKALAVGEIRNELLIEE